MNFLDVKCKQRPYDNMYEVIGRYKDYENKYTYLDPNKKEIALVPDKWITVDVVNQKPTKNELLNLKEKLNGS